MTIATTLANRFVQFVGWLFLVSGLWLSFSSTVLAEQITSFHSEITVNNDSSIEVTETVVYDFGLEYRHGIFRNIDDKHAQPASAWYKQRYIDMEVLSVTKDGVAEPYTLESHDGISAKIGRANKTITGEHVYEIKYVVEGALSESAEEVELYWNVTGNNWPTEILQTTAIVSASSEVSFGADKNCYAGEDGSAGQCKEIISGKNVTLFTQGIIYPGQQLTVAQSLVLPTFVTVLERYNPSLLWVIVLFIGIFSVVAPIYLWRTKYRISRSVIAQYEPYGDFKPMFAGVMFDNRVDSKDISAGIVYLAQQGFISIKQISDKVLYLFDATDYEITLLRFGDEVETDWHRYLLELIFGYTGVKSDGHDFSPRKVRLSDVKESRSKKNYATVKSLKREAIKDLVSHGLLEQKMSRAAKTNIFVIIALVPIFILQENFSLPIKLYMTSLFVIIFLTLFFSAERRTRKGYEALNHLEGFKLFLEVTEKERYKFHNAPKLSPQQFMEYLPYAIAFGVEKEWSEVFRDIQIDAPDWYSSSSGVSFNAAAFTTNLSAFSTSFSSMSGSSGSGSSGRGSSGGGSGGGGGGSW